MPGELFILIQGVAFYVVSTLLATSGALKGKTGFFICILILSGAYAAMANWLIPNLSLTYDFIAAASSYSDNGRFTLLAAAIPAAIGLVRGMR